ncbi:hypothetical protein FHR32_000772 [Streptosporangium album]|uniref:Uncharacterized protein n=1 Tax=Streptosporangium album TaxID=47479 RepID=A0A7W7RQT3_9ACTN|nr:hypothetical protein [Streptosporangium album]
MIDIMRTPVFSTDRSPHGHATPAPGGGDAR